MPQTTTPRGFTEFDQFLDTRANYVTVRRSSSATVDAVWIFCKTRGGFDDSPHLSAPQAKLLVSALNAFIAEVEGNGKQAA